MKGIVVAMDKKGKEMTAATVEMEGGCGVIRMFGTVDMGPVWDFHLFCYTAAKRDWQPTRFARPWQ